MIRVWRSWQGPHRLERERHFYGRRSAGNEPLTIPEIRRAFLQSEGHAERIRSYVANRLIAIAAGETVEPLADSGRLVLLLVPFSGLDPGADTLEVRALRGLDLRPISRGDGLSRRLTLEGIAAWSRSRDGCYSLVTLHRRGILEAVDAYILATFRAGGAPIPGGALIKKMEDALERYLKILRECEVPLPVYVFFHILSVRGRRLLTSEKHAGPYPFDRDNLHLPEVVITDYDAPARQHLDPLFDRIWNAVGVDRAPTG